MPGRKPQLDHVRRDFVAEIDSAISLLKAIQAIPKNIRPNQGQLHPKHERLIAELAFLGLYSSWEEFLERSLVRYVAGATTSKGYSPTPKYGLAKGNDSKNNNSRFLLQPLIDPLHPPYSHPTASVSAHHAGRTRSPRDKVPFMQTPQGLPHEKVTLFTR